MMLRFPGLIALLLMGLVSPLANAGDTLYVQSESAQLKAQPLMDAAVITRVNKGDAVEVLKSQDLWVQVHAGTKTGWLSRLFLNSRKPKTEAELKLEANQESAVKSARRRISTRSATAGVRGLTAGNRVREGREMYASDFNAVDKMDQVKIEEKELRVFKHAGKLGE